MTRQGQDGMIDVLEKVSGTPAVATLWFRSETPGALTLKAQGRVGDVRPSAVEILPRRGPVERIVVDPALVNGWRVGSEGVA